MKKLLLALGLLALPAIVSASAIAEHEKAACEMVADYLVRGPVAVAERLAESSPLSKLARHDAIAEIEARLGPPAGAVWTLRDSPSGEPPRAGFHVVFPSGAQDVVRFTFARTGNEFRVLGMTTLAEIEGLQEWRAYRAELTGRPVTPVEVKMPSKPFFFAVCALLMLALAVRRLLRRTSFLIGIAAVVALAIPYIAWLDPPFLRGTIARNGGTPSFPFIPMRTLVPMRRAMAAGLPIEYSKTADDTGDVAALWAASAMPPGEAGEHLRSLRDLRRSPLATLLHARRLLRAGLAESAASKYAEIRSATHGAFWPELLSAAAQTHDRWYALHGTLDENSREAGIHYLRALHAASERKRKEAREAFLHAWTLRPLSRAELVSTPVLFDLIRDPLMPRFADLQAAEEDVARDEALSTAPMKAPAGSTATASGAFVRIAIGDAQLDIPGGAAIAPTGTVPLTASQFAHAEYADAVRRVDALDGPELTSLAMLRTAERAAKALGYDRQWSRIVDLTDGITAETENLSLEILTWRIRSLAYTKRFDDARKLALGTATREAIDHSGDPQEIIAFAYVLGEAQAWDEAIRALHVADEIEGSPDVSLTIQRFEVRRTVANSPPAATTAHFDIHAWEDVNGAIALRIGDLLEAELARLQSRFGLRTFERVKVHVLPWHLFAGLTGSFHILGFYDGEIVLPFGETARFREEVVAILTHELTHAVIDQLTNNRTPRWLNEGIAQRMELVESQQNIFATRQPGALMPLELLDAFITSQDDATAVTEGYVTALTFIHFLEDRFGESAINRVLGHLRDGKDEQTALAAAMNIRLADADREFRTWGLKHAGPFVNRAPWPYAHLYSVGIDPKIQQSIRWSRPKS